jgi:signal transduction histidine kinase
MMSWNLDDKSMEALQQIRVSGDFLLFEINDILDYSQISKGKMRVNTQTFSLEQVAEQMHHMFDLQFRERGLTLKIELNLETMTINSDIIRLKQILINLIGNAMKFTIKGGVTLHISDVDNDQIEFSVSA